MSPRRLAASVALLSALVGAEGPAATPNEPPDTSTPGAARARSFDELSALVRDPAGPAVIELDAGVHRGDLEIRRPVTLRGRAGAVLEGTGTATVVDIAAHDVTLEDLTIRRSGRRHTAEDAGVKAGGERVRVVRVRVEDCLFGVSLAQCKDCLIERAHVLGRDDDAQLRGDGVKLWEAHGSIVRDTTIERSRDLVVWYTRRAVLEGNTVRAGRYGSHFMYAHDAVVRKSRFEGNVVGVFVMYSARVDVEHNLLAGARGAAGIGLGFKDSDAVTVKGNWMVGNTVGTYLDNTPRVPTQPVILEGNVIALNDVGVRLHSSERGVRVTGNDFHHDATLVEVEGGGDALALDVRGNRYSDYEGYDLDRDGTGDVPHEVKMLSRELTESRTSLKLFQGTAAMGLIDAVAHALPVFSARRLWVDPSPLTQRPSIAQP